MHIEECHKKIKGSAERSDVKGRKKRTAERTTSPRKVRGKERSAKRTTSLRQGTVGSIRKKQREENSKRTTSPRKGTIGRIGKK